MWAGMLEEGEVELGEGEGEEGAEVVVVRAWRGHLMIRRRRRRDRGRMPIKGRGLITTGGINAQGRWLGVG